LEAGTGGCISGVGAVLIGRTDHERPPKIVAVEREASRTLTGGPFAGHRIQGIGIDFVPEIARPDLVGEITAVTDELAYGATRDLTRKKGLLAGVSSGAHVEPAMRIAQRLGKDKRVVTLLSDVGLRSPADDRYR